MILPRHLFRSCIIGLGTGMAACAPSPTWESLMSGDELKGWHKVGGTAQFVAQGNEIIGSTALMSSSTYLLTDTIYQDFILEFESLSESETNSGVQFRTLEDDSKNGGVIGYQLDIDPTERKWTGGIYHQGTNIWRHSMARNKACQNAYKHEAWNRYRVEAVGEIIATWVNDVPCAHIIDNFHDKGTIGLQVHKIADTPENEGLRTRWRKIRVLTNPDDKALWMDRRAGYVEAWTGDTLTPLEIKVGWETVAPSPNNGAYIMAFKNSELLMDVKLSKGAHGQLTYGTALCPAGFIIADNNAAELSENIKLGSLLLDDTITSAKNVSEPGRTRLRYHKDGRDNRIRILIDGDTVQHWTNGIKVTEYKRLNCADHYSGGNMTASLKLKTGSIVIKSAKFRRID